MRDRSSEILYTALKELKILFSVDVEVDTPAFALAVRHLAQDPAVGRCDAFDRREGTVDVPLLVHRDHSFGIAVLRSDLAVREELIDPLLRRHETSFAVGCRIHIDAAELRAGEPGRLIGDDLGIRHLGDMASDRIIGKCGRIPALAGDLAVRDQTELDQRLETVADAQDQAISLIQEKRIKTDRNISCAVRGPDDSRTRGSVS